MVALSGELLGRIWALPLPSGYRTVRYRCDIMVLRDDGWRGVRQID